MLLRLPSARAKVKGEMDKARLDIEQSLCPQGADVVRHLSLPAEGQSLEWIIAEMDKMDQQSGTSEWKRGKISGAVYRMSIVFFFCCTSF